VSGFAELVDEEVARARAKHAPIHSLHEGYAVLLEELDEFWEEVRAWRGGALPEPDEAQRDRARRELVQVAAMARRVYEDLLLPVEPVRGLYRRLAAAHDEEPPVPDRGGGAPGDKFPLL
jgi:hypothetical protein